jgi:uncharacterized pyridoxamine 5'-phosphate oxidase family protein
VTATVVSDDRLEAKKHMLDSYPELKDIESITNMLYNYIIEVHFYKIILKTLQVNICRVLETLGMRI